MKQSTFISLATLLLSLFFATTAVAAHGQSTGGTGQGDQDQTQQQDRVQDPSTHDGDMDTPDQDRDQDRDRVQDPETHDGVTTTPDQDSDRDRDRVQDRDRDPIHMNVATPTPAQNIQQFQQAMQEKRTEWMQQMHQYATDTPQRMTIENQNRIREAVHAFLAAEDLVGGIGSQTSALARQINNRLGQTAELEERIHSRGGFARFFVGGNDEAAQQLEQEQERIREHIQEMQQLMDDCQDCPQQVQTTLQEQLQQMQQERERLHQLAEEEQNDRGIFDVLFGWMR